MSDAPTATDLAGAAHVARQQRLAGWQEFQPTTRNCLERVVAVGGPELAEQLAEAIRREQEGSMAAQCEASVGEQHPLCLLRMSSLSKRPPESPLSMVLVP